MSQPTRQTKEYGTIMMNKSKATSKIYNLEDFV